ncbi:hypothetical protein [Pustulibacterium marinum]|nr:hypothetical protein [Pustulibacterium marinum]
MSAKYLGPNALPVPKIKDGLLPKYTYVKLGGEYQESVGDITRNLYTESYIRLFSNRVGLNIQLVPYEYFSTDSITRAERKVVVHDPSGSAIGDVYIGTYIQLLRDHWWLPDLVLTINLKTASGSKLKMARYTDAPGYFFDVSAGKTFEIENSFIKSFRPYGMLGFYAYQTYETTFKQNDSFLYGIGFHTTFSKFDINNAYGGYNGYIGNGDQPKVYRFIASTTFENRLNFEFRFQKGFKDFEYDTFRICAKYRL